MASANTINDIAAGLVAVQNELGTDPAGTKTDVMISFDDSEVEEYSIQDIFLSKKQALFLYKELGQVIKNNRKIK